MVRDAGGWAELVTREAPPSARYRFRIDGQALVPDPASRFQPDDVHGPSEVVDPLAHGWAGAQWTGVEAARLVFYELHVGTFTPEGTFRAVAARLDHLVALGVTAIELMPVADFPGRFNWGYDGVLPFAPDSRYGRPEELKALVEACHARGLAVFLDAVYNHFGPEGNYLHRYAPQFFSSRHRTPWGDGINVDGPGSEVVRAFLVHNALYWIEEFHLDGLRIDAAHMLRDDSATHVLAELAGAVAAGPGRERAVFLVLENDDNDPRLLARDEHGHARLCQAQWNDDLHHCLHVLVTGEREAYYADYDPPVPALGRCLTEGWAYQGDVSRYRGRPRGHPSAGLPPTAFVNFLQNHDQIGNRALGERIAALAPAEAVRAATAIALLAPALPLLFMGQEWAAPEPFLFFSDLGPDMAPFVVEGRRREFERFAGFATEAARQAIPNPQSAETRERSALDWRRLSSPLHRDWLDFHRGLLRIRGKEIAPLLVGEAVPCARFEAIGATALEVEWAFADGRALRLAANLGAKSVAWEGAPPSWGRRLYALRLLDPLAVEMPPWSVAWFLQESRPGDARSVMPAVDAQPAHSPSRGSEQY
jgi:malto-oligosyltrehalose trehalohydrolase